MTKYEALKLALEALEEINKLSIGENAVFLPAEIDTAMDAIKEALAQPEQEMVPLKDYKDLSALCTRQGIRLMELEDGEPVAWMDDFGNAFPLAANKGAGSWMDKHKRNWKPLYTTPSQRKPLTDEMTKQMRESCDSYEMRGAFVDGWLSAEAAHGIKGEA